MVNDGKNNELVILMNISVVFLNENNRSMFNAIAAYHGFANITIFERDDKPGSVPKTGKLVVSFKIK